MRLTFEMERGQVRFGRLVRQEVSLINKELDREEGGITWNLMNKTDDRGKLLTDTLQSLRINHTYIPKIR